MPDYKTGKIYTIRNNNDTSLIYVGSTCNSLHKRLNGHKNSSEQDNKKTFPFYKTVNGDWNGWYIELYEYCPCENKQQLNRREGQVIREIGTLNKTIAGRTDREYYYDNKEKKTEYKKEYYEENKELISEKNKEYYKKNKELITKKNKEPYTCKCGVKLTTNGKAKHERTKKHQLYIKDNPL